MEKKKKKIKFMFKKKNILTYTIIKIFFLFFSHYFFSFYHLPKHFFNNLIINIFHSNNANHYPKFYFQLHYSLPITSDYSPPIISNN